MCRMKSSGLLIASLLVGGCCQANVNLMHNPEQSMAVATSKKETCAIEKAQEDAAEYCKSQGKTLAVVDQQVEYQGADKTAKAGLSVMSSTIGGGSSLDRNDDYRVQMKFRCD